MSRFLPSLAMLGLISTTVATYLARGDDDEKAKASSIWMKEKLSASQNILAGLTKEDYRGHREKCPIDGLRGLSWRNGSVPIFRDTRR